LEKNKELVIDLEALLSTSAGHPIGNKADEATTIEVASSDMVQSSIDKFLTRCLAKAAPLWCDERREVEHLVVEARRAKL
jgi:hypothetical protein